MKTVDDIGDAVRDGEMTVDEAVRLFQAGDEDGDVVVYAAKGVPEGEETWQDVEDLGSASTLFADLHKAGATAEQMDEIGAQIERIRATGRTYDQVYGWKTTDADTPST